MNAPFTAMSLTLLREEYIVSVAWLGQAYPTFIIYFAGKLHIA